MLVNELMEQRHLTQYRLAKNCGIPQATISDICSGKAKLEQCKAETVYKIARELGVPMETLLEPCMMKRSGFELFKSNVCHRVKELGDIDFIVETLERDDIRRYYERKWYPESLYLLAMLDYLSRLNDVPLCEEYQDLRQYRLREALYPAGVLMASAVAKSNRAKEKARAEAIPEFMRFNIVESEVRNVV